ncbi:YciI family protein [Glaciihabitans sp. dw_435]|uniref:YciI family protein n=1 Tax=Glaciihabitans sp. dw_435 TaxID=2720081 RepID=UPI001BD431F6|nr:YciI family protein [Glaciihabitans sp. dw_435]
MQYSLLLHNAEPQDVEGGISDEAMQSMQIAFADYVRELDAAGVLLFASILQPVAASTTVTLRDRSLRIQDGPFADTREKLAGTFEIDVIDLDAALAWAEKCPGAHYGTVEVRPAALIVRNGQWFPAA